MFVGEYYHSVDEKGRVALPVKFRDELERGAIITRGNDGCLTIYKISEWEELVDKISQLPQSKPEVRSYARLILSGAAEVKLDRQGRGNIPNYLLAYAGVKKKVVIVGVNDRLELWDKQKWEDYKIEMESQTSEMFEQLSEYGL
ncbi:division/cell wall cluster transcriptional repressor MraZ [Patescibacteria group bacterium]|nr:division/cell wall cluster transcriptional repressor MraZ [Patescibacteria group bacterium]